MKESAEISFICSRGNDQYSQFYDAMRLTFITSHVGHLYLEVMGVNNLTN